MNAAEHLADPVTWDCRACGAPWPCPPARAHLRATLDSMHLGVYAAVQLYAAIPQLPDHPPAELWHRFLGWIR